MKIAKSLVACLVPVLLASCSTVSAPLRQKSYLSASSIRPMRIPPGIASNSFRNDYPVSDHDFPGNKDVSLIPPGLNNV